MYFEITTLVIKIGLTQRPVLIFIEAARLRSWIKFNHFLLHQYSLGTNLSLTALTSRTITTKIGTKQSLLVIKNIPYTKTLPIYKRNKKIKNFCLINIFRRTETFSKM